jgi:hypothetical protein
MIDYQNARNEINSIFYADWNLNSIAVAGYVPEIHWQGVEKKESPAGDKTWLRFSQQTVSEKQVTLSDQVVDKGGVRYSIDGILVIEFFCPRNELRAWENGGKYAQIAKNIFRSKGTKNCIWFRNARIQELPIQESFYRFNVFADFEYDEISKAQFSLSSVPVPNIQDICCYDIDGLTFEEIDCGVIDCGTF